MINPFSTPVYVMPKPVGSTCNMACAYCYYLEKKRYYPDARRQMMSEATLEEFVKQYIAAQTTPDVIFTWHGGEATVRKLDFYRRVLEMQKKYGAGRNITNCLQTNATLLTDEWCLFLKRNNWLVGVSIDGPEDFHDEYRRMADAGRRSVPSCAAYACFSVMGWSGTLWRWSMITMPTILSSSTVFSRSWGVGSYSLLP